jgi:hypothetical protein
MQKEQDIELQGGRGLREGDPGGVGVHLVVAQLVQAVVRHAPEVPHLHHTSASANSYHSL